MKDKYLVIILALMVSGTVVAVGFVLWSNRDLPAQTIARIQKEANPCLGLSANEGEIPCEEAVEQVLSMFSGSVYDVQFGTIPYQASLESEQVFVPSWIVYINLTDPVELPNGKTNDVAVAVHSLHSEPYIYLYLAVQ